MSGATWLRRGGLVGVAALALAAVASGAANKTDTPVTRAVFMTAVETKGATTAARLAPPSTDPHTLSAGYEFKAPGVADAHEPGKWEVSAYAFVPSFVTVRQGDRIELTVFVINGDTHAVRIIDPTGRDVAVAAVWNRGREYKLAWLADKPGAYELRCLTHAPTMSATFLVLPLR